MRCFSICLPVLFLVLATQYTSAQFGYNEINEPFAGCDSSVTYSYDKFSNTWTAAKYTVIKTDADHLIDTQYVITLRDNLGDIDTFIRRTIVTRDNLKRTIAISIFYTVKDSLPQLQQLFFYDSQDRINMVIDRHKVAGQMDTSSTSIYHYNSLGQNDSVSGTLVSGLRYDGNGNMVSRIRYRLDTSTNTYRSYSRHSYTYNAQNKRTGWRYESNAYESRWILYEDWKYTYKSNGDPDLIIYRYRGTGSDSIMRDRFVDSFTSAFSFTRWTLYPDTHLSGKTVCMHETPAAVDEYPIPTSLKAYPNPAHTRLNLELPQSCMTGRLIITDISGRIIKRETVLNPTHSIDVSDLAVGTYILQAIAPNGQPYYVKFLKN